MEVKKSSQVHLVRLWFNLRHSKTFIIQPEGQTKSKRDLSLSLRPPKEPQPSFGVAQRSAGAQCTDPLFNTRANSNIWQTPTWILRPYQASISFSNFSLDSDIRHASSLLANNADDELTSTKYGQVIHMLCPVSSNLTYTYSTALQVHIILRHCTRWRGLRGFGTSDRRGGQGKVDAYGCHSWNFVIAIARQGRWNYRPLPRSKGQEEIPKNVSLPAFKVCCLGRLVSASLTFVQFLCRD